MLIPSWPLRPPRLPLRSLPTQSSLRREGPPGTPGLPRSARPTALPPQPTHHLVVHPSFLAPFAHGFEADTSPLSKTLSRSREKRRGQPRRAARPQRSHIVIVAVAVGRTLRPGSSSYELINTTATSRTWEISEGGSLSANFAPRARQSTLLNWSLNTYPVTARPEGISTSKG